jgi:hypothetical protein
MGMCDGTGHVVLARHVAACVAAGGRIWHRQFALEQSRLAGWPGPSRVRPSLLFALVLVAGDCAASVPQSSTMEYKPCRERAETQAQGDVVVTVALPTAADASCMHGRIAKAGPQRQCRF